MCFVFFFNDAATTEIYTLSLHDALPICPCEAAVRVRFNRDGCHERRPPEVDVRRDRGGVEDGVLGAIDRKSTRLNSSHANISHAVFCLKKTHRKSSWSATTGYLPQLMFL